MPMKSKRNIVLELSVLKKTIDSLSKAMHQHNIFPDDEFIRDACIQRFEYTYELCVKFLRRYLALTESSADFVLQMSFPTLIRTASERGLLLSDWTIWKEYRDMRNITNHTYDEKKAMFIVHQLPHFIDEVQCLYKRLKEHIES